MELRRFVLDVHPDKINPRREQEEARNNPGRFDHRVHQEQSFFCGARLTSERRKLSIERDLVADHIDRDILKAKEKARCLRKVSRTHSFLHKLRDVVNELPESECDWIPKSLPYASYDEGVASCSMTHAAAAAAASSAIRGETGDSAPPGAALPAAAAHDSDSAKRAGGTAERADPPSAVGRYRMLSKMKKEIAQCVLPPAKLKRILPNKNASVADTYPIMSSYRKLRILPSIRQQKQEELADRATLRQRINVYFGAAVPISFPPLAPPVPSDEQRLFDALRGTRS